MSNTQTPKMTVAELGGFIFEPHVHYELFDGALVRHHDDDESRPLTRLWVFLLELQSHDDRVPVPALRYTWHVDAHNLFTPDVAYPASHFRSRGMQVGPNEMPDRPILAIDMLEPPNTVPELRRLQAYADAGLPWYWVVESSAPSITVFRHDDGALIEHSFVAGDDVLQLTEPFPIALCPARQLV